MMKFQPGAVGAGFVLLPLLVSAQPETDAIEELVVAGQTAVTRPMESDVAEIMRVDTADALREIPGASANRNGLITGIAQYRGMYGDRVAVSIDNHTIVSGGPNAMDAPLSYVSPMISEALIVERGITSVSSSAESIGGHVMAGLARGDFGTGNFGVTGFVGSRYSANGDVTTTAGRLTLSNEFHRFSTIAELDHGGDVQTPVGSIGPSAIDRKRHDVSYAFAENGNHLVVFAGALDTRDSGTPALPMDIRVIDTNLIGGHFLYALSPELSIEGRISSNDVHHVMDNFALRNAPPPMMQRQTAADGSGQSIALAGTFNFDATWLRVGFDAAFADHDATITNPNNAVFRVANFAGVKRDLARIFGEWSALWDRSDLEIGVSLRRVETAAGAVSASGIMSPSVAELASAFNDADRRLVFDDVDAVIKYRYKPRDSIEWRAEAARKTRAPSYQELYLWLPMQSTGGLADGRSYVGDLDLESEVSAELNLGMTADLERLSVSPQVFFKRIRNFIQGSPSLNATTNGVAMMMGGRPALQFTNTDAEIWGIDIAFALQLSDHLTLDSIASFTRGRRTDVADDLYRLAPLNGSIGLSYTSESWLIDTRIVGVASQKNVASFNNEATSRGYELVNASIAWLPMPSLRLEARVENLLNTSYQDHLAGINRAAGSDIAVGERLYGAERTLSAGVILKF